MSRTIKVKVIDSKGYGKSGYKVKAYGGPVVKTDRDGKASIELDGSWANIYVEGAQVYDGSVNGCPNPLEIER